MFTPKAAHWGARTGVLSLNGKELPTPAFVVATVRSAIPHITPDQPVSPPVAGVYAEDMWDNYGPVEACMNRRTMPLKSELVLAAARRPNSGSAAGKPNKVDQFAIDTVQGTKLVPVSSMTRFMTLLGPDLFVVPYDVPSQTVGPKVGRNRVHKMATRSLDWLNQFHAARSDLNRPLLVAPVPQELASLEYYAEIAGKCDAYTFPPTGGAEPSKEGADPAKLRVGFATKPKWADVLTEISEGTDLVYVPLTPHADAGQALTLNFAATEPEYMDLNDPKYVVDETLLGSTGHSLAYIHHLLNAEEMTARVLLQLHNIAIVERLFADVRDSIAREQFAADLANFIRVYPQ